MTARRFTDEQEQEICRRYEAGESTIELAQVFGTGDATIGKILNRNGIKRRSLSDASKGQQKPHLRKFTDEQEQEICRLYKEERLTTTAIGKVFRVSRNSISRIIARNGYKLRSGGAQRKFTPEQEEEICSRHLDGGETLTDIARELGVTHGGIKKIVERHGFSVVPYVRPRKFTDDQGLEICRLYLEDKKTTREIGEAFGVDHSLIRDVLNRHNCSARSIKEARGGLSAELELEACQRYQLGEDSPVIGDSLGVSATCIRKILDRNGIERRTGGCYGDSIQHVLDHTGHHQHQRECEFYLFELAHYSATHCKPGISFDTDARADEEYGEEALRLFLASRSEAYFLEQAVLDVTRGSAGCPTDLSGWDGHSEVRAMPAADMVPTILRLAEELEELGQWEFAARYVSMTAAQRAICQQRAMVEVAA